MNEQDRQAPTADGAKRKVGGYLFLPRLMQRGAVILWLRRMHAWTGVYGALIFLLLGISGFYLHHRAEMKIENGRLREAASLTAFVEPGAIESEDDLAAWLTREYKVEGKRAPARGRPGEKVSFSGQQAEQPQLIEISFRAPNGTVSAEHAVGSNVVALKRQSASPLKAVIDMHKTVGVSTAFISASCASRISLPSLRASARSASRSLRISAPLSAYFTLMASTFAACSGLRPSSLVNCSVRAFARSSGLFFTLSWACAAMVMPASTAIIISFFMVKFGLLWVRQGPGHKVQCHFPH